MINIVTRKMNEGFWKKRQEIIARHTIYRQYEILNGDRSGLQEEQYSNVIDNFRIAAGRSAKEYTGEVFSDSELGKWIEAAAYSLMQYPNTKLESLVEDIIDLIEDAQEPDGYLNTYYQVKKRDKKFQHFVFGCEMYNMGHLMEAAAAWYQATGRSRFLAIMCKTADLLCHVFLEKEQEGVCDGHPEIELGLLKLYQVTGTKKYKNLALHFIKERGKNPALFLDERYLGATGGEVPDDWFGPDHHLAHLAISEQTKAEGHAVKLCYLYEAVTELILQGDLPEAEYGRAVDAVWENMVEKRMYVTGGIGSQAYAERFTKDYDLPVDRGYLETCASIAVCFWAKKMLDYHKDGKYADVYEWELYNGVLAGWSLDGNRYHYVNILHYKSGISDYRIDTRHVEAKRQPWFHCACCPSNLLRLIGNLVQDCVTVREDVVYVDLYTCMETRLETRNEQFTMRIDTEYPFDGKIKIFFRGTCQEKISVALRIPAWCDSYQLSLNGQIQKNSVKKGYIMITKSWNNEDTIILEFALKYRFLFANSSVWNLNGKAALTKGPLVYCLEEQDNTELAGLCYLLDTDFVETRLSEVDYPIPAVKCQGILRKTKSSLYQYAEPSLLKTEITAIPYFASGNRTQLDMDVWIPYLN